MIVYIQTVSYTLLARACAFSFPTRNGAARARGAGAGRGVDACGRWSFLPSSEGPTRTWYYCTSTVLLVPSDRRSSSAWFSVRALTSYLRICCLSIWVTCAGGFLSGASNRHTPVLPASLADGTGASNNSVLHAGKTYLTQAPPWSVHNGRRVQRR